ncbi:MAG: autotransporter outer membrane beta-barrel domain-containing protein [Desulfobulbus sp.]|uniref:autotransporter outer membrane beta-barrel domain-containing protein n=1 Tax=Desulfobulbus sp. TaxID=895 RepID=UPI00283AD6F4|nr:autotransporter outer membrane beta-barrel domain-containing protein [Desulfobulbus sp.]MDR2549824.1 autotransporter outer membrane beta-barrel domain-containing protein [Desulfobulbus sp.]
MKKRAIPKKKTGVLALALLMSPLLEAPVSQAAEIYIRGGGGGGGGGNSSGTPAAGGGGNGGHIGTTGGGANAGTGAASNVTMGGGGGNGGVGHPNKDGSAGGVGGGGTNTLPGGTGVAGAGENSANSGATGKGGAGGSVNANAVDMAAAGVEGAPGYSVYIYGGDGGSGGATSTGSPGGNGGAGGNARLDWGIGNRSIASLDIKAGANGIGGQSSGGGQGGVGGQGGSAEFVLDGDLTIGALISPGTLDPPPALRIYTHGSNHASFLAKGTVNTSQLELHVSDQSAGNVIYESASLTSGGAPTIQTKGAGDAVAIVHGNANLTNLYVGNSLNSSGNARFTADGAVTLGHMGVVVSGSGDASFEAAQFTQLDPVRSTSIRTWSTSSGNGSITISGPGAVKSQGTISIRTDGTGNASFSAPNADAVQVTGPRTSLLRVISTKSGQASFSALNAVVSTAAGDWNVESSTTDARGTATFLARGLDIAGAATVKSGAAAATATITGTPVKTGALTVNATGVGAARFIANATGLLNTNAIRVEGSGAGDAGIFAGNATINTNGHNVVVSIENAPGGTKGIYARSLITGSDQVDRLNNGSVSVGWDSGTQSDDGSTQLVLTDSLQARSLGLIGKNTPGSVVININNVDVTFIDTSFSFHQTVASSDAGASGVYFKTISLGTADGVRALTINRASLGSYWADTLKVNVHNDPAQSQNWKGNIWLGGHPGTPSTPITPGTATGTVGTVDMVLPANASLTSYLGDGSGANPNYMLTVGGKVTLSDGVAFNLRATQGNPFIGLKVNDQIQLVDSSKPIVDNTTRKVPVHGYSAFGAKDYYFDLLVAENGQDLLATYLWFDPTFAKAYLEGNIAALGNLYQGAELESRVVRNTFDPYVQGGLFKEGAKLGMMFGAEYANMRLDSGSHVDADYYNMVIGPAMRTETGLGRLGMAVFFETGHGDYSSYNSFPGLNVDGDGNTDYYGGGIALRNDFADGLYADLSLRAGTVSTDQNLRNRFKARYDDDTTYVGGRVGLGKIFTLTDRGRLDIYSGLLWTRLSGYDTTTDAAERLEFDVATSLRGQLGGRYHHNFSKTVRGYAGAAWEYEFDGDVGGTLDDVAIDEPSLQGSTGKGELGLSFNPTERLSIDLGIQGYTGEREGVGATAALTFAF